MSNEWTRVSDAPLFHEHLLLGGIFEEDEPLLALPARYGDGSGEHDGLKQACGVSDLAGMSVVLVSGAQAPSFMSAACAGESLSVGECAFGAVITGDGTVAAVPLVARTGDTEFLLVDPTERGLSLIPWLSFLSSIEQDGFRPFEGVKVEDVSTSLHPLLLWGPAAAHVLGDYIKAPDALPSRGQIANVSLDRIMSIISHPACGDNPCYLLLVPPMRARVLWRSFLSFTMVTPVGIDALKSHAQQNLRWLKKMVAEGDADFDHGTLRTHGLVRGQGGYIGERALKNG